MTAHLYELYTVDDLNKALAESSSRPVLIFKHSNTCSISTRAFAEFQTYLEQADPEVGYYLITVQNARAVSNEAASRLAVEHQSPQAILVRENRQRWNKSHFGISVSALAEAINGAKESAAD